MYCTRHAQVLKSASVPQGTVFETGTSANVDCLDSNVLYLGLSVQVEVP